MKVALGHLIRYFYSPSISEDIFYPVRETSPAFPWIGWPWLCSNLHFRNLLEMETERINFRKDFWGCYWRQGKQIDQQLNSPSLVTIPEVFVKANSAQSPSDFLSGDISLVPRAFLLSQTKTEQSPVQHYPLDLILYPVDRAIGFPNIYIIRWIVIYPADNFFKRFTGKLETREKRGVRFTFEKSRNSLLQLLTVVCQASQYQVIVIFE